MRLPGAALLIVIGLLILWAAITGRLDRVATAWDYLKGGTLPTEGAAGTEMPIINRLNSIMHRDSYHVAAFQNAIATPSPGIADYPGGIL